MGNRDAHGDRDKTIMSVRDFQRQRVYNSEDLMDVGHGKRLETVPEMQTWVDKIVRSKWFRNRWPYLTYIQVKDGRGRRRATGYAKGSRQHYETFGITTEGILKMPRWSRSELFILHEITHVIIDHVHKRKVPAHGREFCNLYLSLVKRFMGKVAHHDLKICFKEVGVIHRRKAQ